MCCNWAKFKDRILSLLLRSRESRLVKYSRINPTYPFERRAPGVLVFTHIKSNNIYSGFWILVASAAFFAYIGTSVASTFSQLDQLFFPCLGILISLYILWKNLWPLTIVLNYPKFRYEYYVGEQIISVGPIVDAYVKLKLLFAGEEDMFYHIVIGATDMPELEFTSLSSHGDLYRRVAKRLARTLNLNYFDVMDLSHLHECRHPTSRHLDSILQRETGMLREIQKDIQREYITHRIDLFRKSGDPLETMADACETPNWPFVKPEQLSLGVPLERAQKLRGERRAKQTLSWRLKQVPVVMASLLRTLRICLLGRRISDDPRAAAAGQKNAQPAAAAAVHQDEEEIDAILEDQLIAQMDEADRGSRNRWLCRPLLPVRTGKCGHNYQLSVDDRVLMRRVARYMALRSLVRKAGRDVPGLSKDLSFLRIYTFHPDYPMYYHAEMDAIDPMYQWHSCLAVRNRQVHPRATSFSG